jgi:hypothetical protein
VNSNDGMVMWLLGGAGVFLLYSAYKNQQPQALLASHINGTPADAPISNYTATTVPTITGPDGKTWNTAPGDGGYITTDPPTPEQPYGSQTPYMLGGYGTRQDVSGTHNIVDSTGRMIGVVPANYQGTPGLYIHNGRA